MHASFPNLYIILQIPRTIITPSFKTTQHLSLSPLSITVPSLSSIFIFFKSSNSCSSCSSPFLATFKWCEDTKVFPRCSLVIQASYHQNIILQPT
ncbi:hypothetical protein HanPSC8_Chr10g0422761 [Helianthus annuus]|nr:hypothetical protein HanPSC8_Chr10g0422761 [Helianthus annuus]